MATTKATQLAHNVAHSGVTSAVLSAKAPLASPAFTGTPTGLTKAHVGLGNVDNVADASQTSLGTVTSGTFNSTIGDSAGMSNKYWRTARVHSAVPISSGGQMINTVTTTNPYFEAGDGDTTNLPYADTNKIQVVRAGIYMVTFALTHLYGSSSESTVSYTHLRAHET